jgi:putative sigma-54 modulation protein
MNMDIHIHTRNLKLNEALEEYARRKLDRLDRYLPNISDVRLELARERTRRGVDVVEAQITIRHARGAILRAEERQNGGDVQDLQGVLSAAVDKMYRQIERFKGKHARKGSDRFSATVEELEQAEALPTEFDTQEMFEAIARDYPEEPLVVRHKAIDLTPMSEQDAIEQMELLGHAFFVFFNQNTGGVNVLYRRSDGDYGVLVPTVVQ